MMEGYTDCDQARIILGRVVEHSHTEGCIEARWRSSAEQDRNVHPKREKAGDVTHARGEMYMG
jgi:hypothetical protein